MRKLQRQRAVAVLVAALAVAALAGRLATMPTPPVPAAVELAAPAEPATAAVAGTMSAPATPAHADSMAAELGGAPSTPIEWVEPSRLRPRAAGPVAAAARAPDPTRGFRASPAQQAQDLADYLTAEDLAELQAALQLRADAGDADAARRLAEILDECLGVQRTISNGTQAVRPAFGDWHPPDAAQRQAAFEIGVRRCRAILPGGEARAASAALWERLREARRLESALGHPAALEGAPHATGELTHWAHQRTAALLADGSAEALFAIGATIAGIAARYDEAAWILAACELGYPCRAQSPWLRTWCVDFGSFCAGEGIIDYLRADSTPGEWRNALADRDDILRLLRAGNLRALLLPAGEVRIGGE